MKTALPLLLALVSVPAFAAAKTAPRNFEIYLYAVQSVETMDDSWRMVSLARDGRNATIVCNVESGARTDGAVWIEERDVRASVPREVCDAFLSSVAADGAELLAGETYRIFIGIDDHVVSLIERVEPEAADGARR